MKVLYLVSGISSPAGWGTEYIQNLIVTLSKKGINPTIISPILLHSNKDWKEWSKKQYDIHRIRIITVNTPNWLKQKPLLHLAITNILSTAAAIRLLTKERCDLIHEFSSAPAILFRSFIFKLLFRTPTIFTLSLYNSTFLGKFFWFKIFNFAKYYTISSREISNMILKIGVIPKKVFYIPPGINLSMFAKRRNKSKERKKLSLPQEKFILTYYGTLTQEKGVLDMLNAYMSLEQELKDAMQLLLCVVWRGSSEHEEIKRHIFSLKQKNILLLESYIDIPSLIWASDAIILPQQTGSGTTIPPISIIEVLAANKILIATDIIGNREIISSGGLLVPPKSPVQLAHVMKLVYTKRHLLKRSIPENSKAMAKFNLDIVAEQYFSLYSKCKNHSV